MLLQLLLVLPLLYTINAIRVPVVQIEESTEVISQNEDISTLRPIYYESESDESNVDSYLIPPNPHNQEEESLSDAKSTLATYLTPPPPEARSDYYLPTEPAVQTDWYPIVQSLPTAQPNNYKINPISLQTNPLLIPKVRNQDRPFIKSKVKKFNDATQFNFPYPSRDLQPPSSDERSQFYIPVPAKELELPLVETNQKFIIPTPASEFQLPILEANKKFHNTQIKKIPLHFDPADPTLSLHFIPPKPLAANIYKIPTNLYPKKYANGFKPIPIPISHYVDNSHVPKAIPVKSIIPTSNPEENFRAPIDDKKIYLYQQAEQKRRLRDPYESEKEQLDVDVVPSTVSTEQTYGAQVTEQDTSETGFRRPQPQRLVEGAPPKEDDAAVPPAPKDRTEFRVHGMKGPHSYQFGYDTGKGKNRQFRYEERDNAGRVRGHYGYMDRAGKLRVVNYDADPEGGFRADTP